MKIARVVTQHFFKGASLAFHTKFYTASFFLFLIAALATIVFGIFGNWTISIAAGLLLIARFIIKAMVFRRSSLLLPCSLCMSLLILEFALPLYNMYIHIYRKFRGKIDYTSKNLNLNQMKTFKDFTLILLGTATLMAST